MQKKRFFAKTKQIFDQRRAKLYRILSSKPIKWVKCIFGARFSKILPAALLHVQIQCIFFVLSRYLS
jgi:hypothetical protein